MSLAMNKVFALKREMAVKVHQLGFAGAMKLAAAKAGRSLRKMVSPQKEQLHPFDIKYGTDTSGIVEVGALDMPDERVQHAVRYQTALVDVFESLLNELSIPFEQYVFIDLGSGKGRAMLLASRFPFKAIFGVELSSSLHQIACQNIEIYHADLQRCRNITSLCQDAARFSIPNENLVFYLFNPFDAEVMRSVVANIEESIRKFPRQIYILYLKALCRDIFDKSLLFRLLKETERYVIYESISGSL
jgi:hypothetical protein